MRRAGARALRRCDPDTCRGAVGAAPWAALTQAREPHSLRDTKGPPVVVCTSAGRTCCTTPGSTRYGSAQDSQVWYRTGKPGEAQHGEARYG